MKVSARSLQTGETKERTILPLDLKKIHKHDSPITGLELHLTEWDRGDVSASISLKGFSNRSYPVHSWKSLTKAKEEYPAIEEKFKRGEYIIDVYSNGEVKITLLD